MSEFGSIKNPPDEAPDNSNLNNESFAQFGVASKGDTAAAKFKDHQVSKQADQAKNEAAKSGENGNGGGFQQLSNGLLPTLNGNNANNSKKPGGKSRCIGHYMIGKNIGEGTFGKVKAGTHNVTGEKVSVTDIFLVSNNMKVYLTRLYPIIAKELDYSGCTFQSSV